MDYSGVKLGSIHLLNDPKASLDLAQFLDRRESENVNNQSTSMVMNESCNDESLKKFKQTKNIFHCGYTITPADFNDFRRSVADNYWENS